MSKYQYKEVIYIKNMSDSNLLQNLPGLRDYYPAEFNKILHILDTMRQVSISYGYNEYEGPSIEKTKINRS